MRTLQSQLVISTMQRLTLPQAASMFVNQTEPKVAELVDELVNDPEEDHAPILRKWARAYPAYAEAVQWIMDNRSVPAIVAALRAEVQARKKVVKE